MFVIFFVQTQQASQTSSWKIHAGDVLSSLSLFRVCCTKLHAGPVGCCPTRSVNSRIGCNPPFFSYKLHIFCELHTMAKKNPLQKGKKLLEYWAGKSIHHIDIG